VVKPDLVAAKLTELSDRVARVRASCPKTAEGLAANRGLAEGFARLEEQGILSARQQPRSPGR
jgi:hypothetical protein